MSKFTLEGCPDYELYNLVKKIVTVLEKKIIYINPCKNVNIGKIVIIYLSNLSKEKVHIFNSKSYVIEYLFYGSYKSKNMIKALLL